MPTPPLLVLGVAAVLGLVALVVLGRLALRAYLKYRGTRVVVCPENREIAAVQVDAGAAALTAPYGPTTLRLESCSRWPEREHCGQECLGQIQAAPEACLLRNILTDWYREKSCAFCGRPFGEIHWHDHRPALLSPSKLTVEWSEFQPEQVVDVLASHRPVCWNCHIAESFRREHPELVTDRPPRTSHEADSTDRHEAR